MVFEQSRTAKTWLARRLEALDGGDLGQGTCITPQLRLGATPQEQTCSLRISTMMAGPSDPSIIGSWHRHIVEPETFVSRRDSRSSYFGRGHFHVPPNETGRSRPRQLSSIIVLIKPDGRDPCPGKVLYGPYSESGLSQLLAVLPRSPTYRRAPTLLRG